MHDMKARVTKVPDHDTLADADWTQIPSGSYTISPIKETGESGYYVRKFALNDEVNGNRWAVTPESIKARMETFVDQPAVMIPGEMAHPTPDIQDAYKVGEIVGVRVLNDGKLAEDTLRLDEHVAQLIYTGTIRYTSVQVSFWNFEIVNEGTPFEYTLLHDWVGRHDALVAEPAYGRDKAVIKHICKGSESECKRRLPASAAKDPRRSAYPIEYRTDPAHTIEQYLSAAYQPCTLNGIVEGAAKGTAIASMRDDRKLSLTPAQNIAIAISPDVLKDAGPSIMSAISKSMAALDRR